MYKLKSSGPKMEPCGTPCRMVIGVDKASLYGVRKWTKLPTPFRGVAAPLRGANHITVSSFLFRRGVVFSFRRFYFVVASRFRCVVFLFHRGVVFSFRRFYFVVASCFRFVMFLFRRGV